MKRSMQVKTAQPWPWQVDGLGNIETPILRATTMTGHGHTVESLPIAKTIQILKKYGAIK